MLLTLNDRLPAFLFADWLGKPIWMWLGFHAVVFVLLALDLGLLHRRRDPVPGEAAGHVIGVAESLALTAFYVALGLAFGGFVWAWLGPRAGEEYLAGLVIEKSLSMDNVFVFAVIFAALGVPRAAQHRVLVWGILAAIVMRGAMIGLGSALVHQFHWVLAVFAVFLVIVGARMLAGGTEHGGVGGNPLESSALMRAARRTLRVTPDLHGDAFTVRRPGPSGRPVLWLTPLALALILVNGADVLFAVDSVPAIFAITTDPYIVYTSNIFAILGLRALYFALAAMVDRFAYLKQALALVLIFIGAKIVVADELDLVDVPPLASLAVTLALLGAGVAYSLWRTREAPAAGRAPG